MDINVGDFVYLNDKYFKDFPDERLVSNRDDDGESKRAWFFVFDVRNSVYWVVPVSSKVEKYQPIYEKKLEKYKICDTLAFGKVNDKEKAFLIQNMCPVSEEYIDSIHHNEQPVLDKELKKEVTTKAKKVLSLVRQGRNFIFPDSLAIEAKLLAKAGIEVQPYKTVYRERGAPPPQQRG